MNNIATKETTSLNKEALIKAEGKCRESRKLVKQATETQNPQCMFKAIEGYTEAIAIYPRLLEPYLSIAYISLEYHQKDNAMMLLNKALEMDPTNKRAKNLLERAKSNSITKVEKVETEIKVIPSGDFPSKERIQSVQRLGSLNQVTNIPLKTKVREENFQILTELFMEGRTPTVEKEEILERKIEASQLTKEKIENLEKLKASTNRDVKVTIGTTSPFSKLLKK